MTSTDNKNGKSRSAQAGASDTGENPGSDSQVEESEADLSEESAYPGGSYYDESVADKEPDDSQAPNTGYRWQDPASQEKNDEK